MAGKKNRQGRKPSAATIVDRNRDRDDTSSKRRIAPPAPRYLGPAGAKIWNATWHKLDDEGLIADLDLDALGIYCSASATWLEAEKSLTGPPGLCPNCDPSADQEPAFPCNKPQHLGPEYGKLVRGRLGSQIRSPYLAIQKEAQRQMAWFMGEFGLTQASRSRIPREPKRDRNPRAVVPVKGQQGDPRQTMDWPIVVGNS